jgi:hypothetical protein
MTPEQNKECVIANDRDIERQVPGILQDTLRVQDTSKIVSNRPEELFWRAVGR